MVTYIFYRVIIAHILSSLILTKKIYRTEKKKVKACKKSLLWNANYDREINDYTNALPPRRFKWYDF